MEYVKDETRAAYFSPGELIAKVKVKKSGQSTEAVYQAKVFTAESRHIYTLTLDVDAGSATMTVSFLRMSQEKKSDSTCRMQL